MKVVWSMFLFILINQTVLATDFEQAIEYTKTKNWEEAKTLFVKHLEKNPRDAWAHFNIGLCLYHQKKYPEAIWYFEKSNKLNPSVTDAVQQIEACHKELNNLYAWTPPQGYFKSKLLQLSMNTWTWIAIALSCCTGLLIFLSFLNKPYRKALRFFSFFVGILMCFSVYACIQKSSYLNSKTHGIILESSDKTYAGDSGNGLLTVPIRAGERVELINEGKRIEVKLQNESVVWLDPQQIKLY